jgi:hypothetical protein
MSGQVSLDNVDKCPPTEWTDNTPLKGCLSTVRPLGRER